MSLQFYSRAPHKVGSTHATLTLRGANNIAPHASHFFPKDGAFRRRVPTSTFSHSPFQKKLAHMQACAERRVVYTATKHTMRKGAV